MKKLFLTMAVLTTMAFTVQAQNLLTKEYDLGKITSIDASSVYNIEVTKGDSQKVTIEYDEAYKDRLIVKYYNGKLELAIEPAKGLLKNINKPQNGIKVYLQMAAIEELDLSGSTKFNATGSFKTDDLDIELSGSSSITSLEIYGDGLSVDCNASSSISMAGDFKSMEIQCSGASKASINGNCNYFDGNFSGASKATLYGEHKNTDIECSGAASVTLEGSTDYFKSVSSGAASLKAQNFTAANGYTEVTGAANAQVRCTGDLKIMVGKAAKLTHYGNPTITDLSKNSNIKKGDQ